MLLYRGRNPESTSAVNSASSFVLDLASPFFNTGRNVTTDRFYTSIKLAIELFKNGLSFVGTCMTNRKYLPDESRSVLINPNLEDELKERSDMTNGEKKQAKRLNWREKYTSKFFYSKLVDTYLIVQSYMVKPKKVLLFVSTMFFSSDIKPTIKNKQNVKKKSDLNLYYNSTKGGVDVVDNMCRVYSVKRNTKRWPISLLFTFLDVTAINAHTICRLTNVYPELNARRDLFLYQLGCELAADYVSKRDHSKLSIAHKQSMNEILVTANKTRADREKFTLIDILKYTKNTDTNNNENSLEVSNSIEKSQNVCYLCSKDLKEKIKEDPNFKIPQFRDRTKFKNKCINCKNFICKNHLKVVKSCTECSKESV